MIGLDGATLDLIEPWVRAGYLPNLKKLMETGVYSRLASTLQPLTAPAWTTCFTGVNQAKHGVFDFIRRQDASYALEVTNSTHIMYPTIFEIASAMGKRVITVNVPYTSPPREINGIMIGGPFAPALTPDMVYPSSYYKRLKQIVPDYFILPNYETRVDDPLLVYAEKLLVSIEQREKISLHLLQTEAWDMFVVVFMAIDEVQHAFWHFQESKDPSDKKYKHIIREIYQRVDTAIGRLLASVAEQNSGNTPIVLIASDHGAGPLRWLVNLNRFLADGGFLQFKPQKTNVWVHTRSSYLKKLSNLYRQRMPSKIRKLIRTKLGAHKFETVKAGLESTLLTSAINWQQTYAYALGAGGNIFINLEGREPSGIVSPGEMYEQLCENIKNNLETMRGPDGKRIVKKVYRRDELYHGKYIDSAPDLIIEWNDYSYWGRGRYDSASDPLFQQQNQQDFSAMPLTGTHKLDGVLIMNGSGVRTGVKVDKAHLLDIAPTILQLLGIMPEENFDGALMTQLFQSAKLKQLQHNLIPYQFTSENDLYNFDSDTEEKIKQHLKALGYM